MCLTLVLQLGGVVYVLIVLIVLSLAIPLAQAANFFVGILYDAVILLMAASRSAEDETEAASGGSAGAAGAAGAGGRGGRGGGGGASSKVQRAKEEQKKQTKRLSSVFSRSRNRGKSGEGSSCDAGSSRDGKPDEWPNKPRTELATQRDVNLAIASLRRAVASLTASKETNNKEKFEILTKALYDLRFINVSSLRSFTINELAAIQKDLERLRNSEVGGLRSYTTKSITDVRMLVEELQRQNGGGGGRGGGGGAVLSRQNRPPSTNPFQASVVQSGVFGALAERAQAWFASRRRVAYDEVSPASEDDDYNDYNVDDPISDTAGASSTVLHHVFDVFDVEHVGAAVGHGPSPSERSAMELFGGVLPPV